MLFCSWSAVTLFLSSHSFATRIVYATTGSNWKDNAAFDGPTSYFTSCYPTSPIPANVHEGNITLTITSPIPPDASISTQPRQKVTVFVYIQNGSAANPAYWPSAASVTPSCTVPPAPSPTNPPYCILEQGQSVQFQFGHMPDEAEEPRVFKIVVDTVDATNLVIPDNGILLASGTWWVGVNNRCKTGMNIQPIIVAGGKPF